MRGLILLLMFVSAPAHAEALAQAKEHYARANTAYDLQQYLEAAHEYEEAFRLKPDPVLLFNIGQSYRNAREYEKAIGAYRSFVRRLPGSPHRAEVEERINDLRALLEAQKRDHERPPAGTAPVELKPGDASTPPVVPPALPPPVVVAPPLTLPPPHDDHRGRNLKIAGTVVAVAGLGLLGGGVALELARRSADDALAHPTSGTPYSPSLADHVTTDRAAEAALFAVGGAALIAGTVTAILGWRRARIAPQIAFGRIGLLVQLELP